MHGVSATMEASDEGNDFNGESNWGGMKWADVKQLQHRYIVHFPKDLAGHIQIEVGLPYPITNPVEVANHNGCKELFRLQHKRDTRLEFYKKLYSKSNKKLLAKNIKNDKIVYIPQYVVDVAQGAFDAYEDDAWCYTGGTLDCFSFNNTTFLAKAVPQQVVQVTDLNVLNRNLCLKLDDDSPAYNVRVAANDVCALLAVRQKRRVSLFRLFPDGGDIRANLVWKMKTLGLAFVDMTFNEYKSNEVSIVDNTHNFKVKDFERSELLWNYDFSTEDALSDSFAQIDYIDKNTVCFINRCCIYWLDVRSRAIQKSCLKTTWAKCDDLCTFSKNRSNVHSIVITSAHNVMKFDARSFKCVSKVVHMLSTPPLMSRVITNAYGECICVFGQAIKDKVLLYNNGNLLNIPRYIPNTEDALTATILTRKVHISDYVEERFSFPTLGMALHKDACSNDIHLYTLNSPGDIFHQNISQTKPTCMSAVKEIDNWIKKLSYKPKVLEATSICNLNGVMNTISTCCPQEHKLKDLMKENSSQKFFEREFAGLAKYVKEGSVGEAMNSVWGGAPVVENIDVSPSMSSKHKVTEWLQSV